MSESRRDHVPEPETTIPHPGRGARGPVVIVRDPVVIYRCDSFAAVDKPPLWDTQAPPGCPSVETWLAGELGVPEKSVRAVHRLDRVTGGILLLALTKKAARLLSEQFAAGQIGKVYHAAIRKPKTSAGDAFDWINTDGPNDWTDWIAKQKNSPRVHLVPDVNARQVHTSDGVVPLEKPLLARTKISRLRENQDGDDGVDADWLRVQFEPQSGRMHQLRAQSAGRSAPIVGDRLYGDNGPWPAGLTTHFEAGGIALRSVMLTLRHPMTAKPIRLRQVLPARPGTG